MPMDFLRQTSPSDDVKEYDDGMLDYKKFQEEVVLPIGGVLQGFKKGQRDPNLQECFLYLFFLAMFLSVTTMVRPVHEIFTIQDALYGELAGDPIAPDVNFEKTFTDIATHDEFWAWATNVLYDKAFQCCYYNDDPVSRAYGETNDMAIAKFNRLITPIRFRQVRVKQDECNTPESAHELSRPCWPAYKKSVRDQLNVFVKSALMPSSYSTFLEGLSTHDGEYNDGGNYGKDAHVVDLDLDTGVAFEKVKGMVRERWTDHATRAVAVDVNTYNPNIDIATAFRFQIDIVQGGQIIPHVEAKSCRLSPYNRFEDKCRAVLECFFILLLCYYIFKEVVVIIGQPCRYFYSLKSLIDLANLVFFVLMVARWADYLMRDKSPFRVRSTVEFHDLHTLCSVYNSTADFAAFCVVCSSFRVFKYLHFSSRCLLIWDALVMSAKAVFPFVGVIILVFSGFAWSGQWLFGARVYDFHTWTMTMTFLFRSLVDGPKVQRKGVEIDVYGPMKSANPSGAPVWMAVWTVLSMFVLLNVFIAILVNAFMTVSDRYRNQIRVEEAHQPESWGLYLRSKFPCFTRDPDMREHLDEVRAEEKAWRRCLRLVDKDHLWNILMEQCSKNIFDLEVRDVMRLFPDEDEYASYTHAVAWMKELSASTRLPLRRTEEEATTMWEIGALTEHVAKLEEEVVGLISQLDKVAPGTKAVTYDPL